MAKKNKKELWKQVFLEMEATLCLNIAEFESRFFLYLKSFALILNVRLINMLSYQYVRYDKNATGIERQIWEF